MKKKSLLCVLICVLKLSLVHGHINLIWEPATSAFDTELYERVLDSEECSRQLGILRNNTFLLAQFLDAGIRLPNGLFIGNNVHLGNYHQCLGISHNVEGSSIEGKYCMINVPGNQTFQLPNPPWFDVDLRKLSLQKDVMNSIEDYQLRKNGFTNMFGTDVDSRTLPINPFAGSTFRLAVCLPKSCTTQEFINGLLVNLTSFGFQYRDDFCRLNDDKPWSPADTAAVVVFSVIGFLVLLSTSYDLWQTKLIRKDPESVSSYLRSFSVYTNTRRLLKFTPNANAIPCLDGVRTLAMLWVLVGHSFTSQPFTYNNFDVFQWIVSAKSLWVQAGHVTVDTFFLLSGLLVVYSTAGKFTSIKLLKNIHLFYLNRLLRMFPILATVALLEASLFHSLFDGPVWGTPAAHADRCRAFWWTTLLHVQNYVNPERVKGGVAGHTYTSNIHLFYLNRLLRMFPILATVALLEASLFHSLFDGPVWGTPAAHADRCRAFWWTTLLHVQNYVNPERVCIGATWYLAIDVQLHILSPIVLVWVLSGNNRLAWTALTASLVGVLAGAAVYCFQNDFPPGMMNDQMMFYMVYYYMNTLTRASPFMVGMVYGYLLHLCRDQRLKIPALVNMTLWVISLALIALVIYAVLPTVQVDWDNQLVNNLYNSFLRPTWAMALGWVIFACAKGYGGPINWFLSLGFWKLPARLSYAMYLFHFSLMTVINSSRIQPIWFSVEYIIFLLLGYTLLTFIVSFVATVVIDAPLTFFFKRLLDRGNTKPVKKDTEPINAFRPYRFPARLNYYKNN